MLYDQMKRWMRKPSMFGILEEIRASYGFSGISIHRLRQKETAFFALRDGLLLLIGLLTYELTIRGLTIANDRDAKPVHIAFLCGAAGFACIAFVNLLSEGVLRLCCYVLDIHSPRYMHMSFDYLEMRTSNSLASLALRESMAEQKNSCPILARWTLRQSYMVRAMEEVRLQPFNTLIQVHSIGLLASLNRKVRYPNKTVSTCACDLIAYDRGYDPTELPGNVFDVPMRSRLITVNALHNIFTRCLGHVRFKDTTSNSR